MNRLLISAFGAALLFGCAARRADAQFLGYTSPQTVVSTAFSAVSTPQVSASLRNVGQSVHLLAYEISGASSTGEVSIQLEASFDGANYFVISNPGTKPDRGILYAVGYFPFVRARLTSFTNFGVGATLTARYTGTSVTPGQPSGDVVNAAATRNFTLADLSATRTQIISSPVGHSGGVLYSSFTFSGGGCSGQGRISVISNALDTTQPSTPASLGIRVFSRIFEVGAPRVLAIPSIPSETLTVSFEPISVTSGANCGFAIVYAFDAQPDRQDHLDFGFDPRDAAGIFDDVIGPGGNAFLPVSFISPSQHSVQLEVTGSPTTCTFQLEGSLDNVSYVSLSSAVDCTVAANRLFHIVNKPVSFVRGNLTALGGGASPTVTLHYVGAR